jgi:hypothetical protein
MKPPRLDTIPQTPDEMTALLFEAGRAGAYVKVSGAARSKRLTEHDIALVERDIIAELTSIDPRIADEFKTFEAEPAFAKARDLLKQFFAHAKAARIKDVE